MIAQPITGENSSLITQYVIHVGESGPLSSELNSVFFFYPDGLKSALKNLIADYVHTHDPLDHQVIAPYARIMEDLDCWLMEAERNNALPSKQYQDIYEDTIFACEFLDSYLYQYFNTYFKKLTFRVVTVLDLVPRHANQYKYVITVDFNSVELVRYA